VKYGKGFEALKIPNKRENDNRVKRVKKKERESER